MKVETLQVNFESNGDQIKGLLFVPADPAASVVLTGPLTSVKEQATGAYAKALAARGFAALAFDHRFFGESEGEPRQYESPPKKIEDVRHALTFLQNHPTTTGLPLAAVGVCAGGGYMAGAVAADPRIEAFAAVAGFFHDAEQQKVWMGEERLREEIAKADAAREEFRTSGKVQVIPAVGKNGKDVAMPLAEAFEYYGTPRGAVSNYINEFALMSRADTLTYDAQRAANAIRVPTLLIHAENALSPALARKFFDNLSGEKKIYWLDSKGQIDFYDDPTLIEPATDLMAEHFRVHLKR